MFGKLKGPTFCAICAHDIRSPQCPHPWNVPFEKWPKEALAKLRQMCPRDWEHR